MCGPLDLEYYILCTALPCGGNTTGGTSSMKNPIEKLNKIFESRIRLGIMSALLVNDEVNFNDLKELIQVTDGNLASHLKTLEESAYSKVKKGFVGRKTNT